MKRDQNHDHHRAGVPQRVPVCFALSYPTAITVCVAKIADSSQPAAKAQHPSRRARSLEETALTPGTFAYGPVVPGQWGPGPAARETGPPPFGGRNSVFKMASAAKAFHFTLPRNS